MAQQRIPFLWSNANFNWNNNPYTWNDCAIIIDVLAAVGGHGTQGAYDKYKKDKKLIKLICKVKGEEFKETHEIKDIEIFIKDVTLVAKEVLNIELKVDL